VARQQNASLGLLTEGGSLQRHFGSRAREIRRHRALRLKTHLKGCEADFSQGFITRGAPAKAKDGGPLAMTLA
jgi:hypothetical protein